MLFLPCYGKIYGNSFKINKCVLGVCILFDTLISCKLFHTQNMNILNYQKIDIKKMGTKNVYSFYL